MANRIKSISKYSGTAWGTETPIGADAANVDLATSYTTVTESTATSGETAEAAIEKIHTDTTNLKKAGHGNGTVTNYDSTSSETSKVLTTDCVVAASDDTATAWSKFNRFRRRVSNKFADYFQTANLTTSTTGVTTTGSDTTAYTTKAINNYLANVVGYTSSTAPAAGTIASQLSTLNNKTITSITRSGTTFTAKHNSTDLFTFTQQDNDHPFAYKTGSYDNTYFQANYWYTVNSDIPAYAVLYFGFRTGQIWANRNVYFSATGTVAQVAVGEAGNYSFNWALVYIP